MSLVVKLMALIMNYAITAVLYNLQGLQWQ